MPRRFYQNKKNMNVSDLSGKQTEWIRVYSAPPAFSHFGCELCVRLPILQSEELDEKK